MRHRRGRVARRARDIGKSLVIAVAYFVAATLWSWWRFRERERRSERQEESVTDDLVEALCGDLSSIRAPRGSTLNARSWQTEAPLRMLLNNLDPEVAEHPEDLVVYGGSGRAARSHDALKAIVRTLLRLRRRRDAARAEREARRRLPDPSGRAARADRERPDRARAGRRGTSSAGSRRRA